MLDQISAFGTWLVNTPAMCFAYLVTGLLCALACMKDQAVNLPAQINKEHPEPGWKLFAWFFYALAGVIVFVFITLLWWPCCIWMFLDSVFDSPEAPEVCHE